MVASTRIDTRHFAIIALCVCMLAHAATAGVDVNDNRAPSRPRSPLRRSILDAIPGSRDPGTGAAAVAVDWTTTQVSVGVTPSLQVVAHALLMRDSPIYEKAFSLLKALGPSYLRYVPWEPTPRLAVAELNPPSGNALCAGDPTPDGSVASLDCGSDGGVIESVTFASYGNPAGHCGGYTAGTCSAPVSKSVVESACVGKQSCGVAVSAAAFNGTGWCPSVATKTLAVQVQCSNTTKQHTYWDFTLLDEQFLDVWTAIDGDNTNAIPNFSTQPAWLYSDNYGYNHECNQANKCTYPGYTNGPAPASLRGGGPALGEYYGRLVSWYTRGGMTDEYGAWHPSGHHLKFALYEIFNEVDYEHQYTAETYTVDYDHIVRGIRAAADPQKNIKFVGMSLPNIDDQAKVVAFATYFLNQTNHHPDARDSLDFIGFHAYPTNGPYGPPESFSQLFDYAETFFATVKAVDAVTTALSPTTRLCLDETGTASGVTSLADPTYWVASGAYWAYLFARVATLGDRVVVMGQSQFMDSPDREAAVSMLNWETGAGTAKYWVTKLMIDSFSLGDDLVPTTVTVSASVTNSVAGPATPVATADVFAQAYVHKADGSRRLLLINRRYAPVTVQVGGGCKALVVDSVSNESPARALACDPAGAITLLGYATAVLTL